MTRSLQDPSTVELSDGDSVELATSGHTGQPVRWSRSLAQCKAELEVVLPHDRQFSQVVSFAPDTHLYGFLFSRLLPASCHAPVVEAWRCSLNVPGVAPRGRVLIVAIPSAWPIIGRMLDRFGDLGRVTLLHSTGLLPEAAGAIIPCLTSGGASVREIFGSTETGGVAYRAHGVSQSRDWVLFEDVHLVDTEPDASGIQRLTIESPRIGRRVDMLRSPSRWEMPDLVVRRGPRSFELIGRESRFVKVNGRRCDLDHIESALRGRGGIRDVVCIPRTSAVRGEHYDLYFTTDAEAPTLSAVRQLTRQVLQGNPAPRDLIRVREIPKTALGKIRFSDLAANAALSGDALDNRVLFQRSRRRAQELLARDAELEALESQASARDAMLEGELFVVELLARVCRSFGERRAFGFRERELRATDTTPTPTLSAYRWLSYQQLWRRVVACATGLAERAQIREGTLVGICGFTGVDYVVAEYACFYLGAVVAPLPAAADPSELQQILVEGRYSTLIVDADLVGALLDVSSRCPSVRHVLILPARGRDASVESCGESPCTSAEVRVQSLAELESRGERLPPRRPQRPGDGPSALRMLLYTSGSSGAPKGVMFTERMLAEYWRKAVLEPRGTPPDADEPMPQVDIGVSFMPQNHLMGQLNVIESLARGGTLHFTAMPDMSTLFDDIRLARPTSLTLVPRVADRIRQHYEHELARRAGDLPADAALQAGLMREMGASFLGDRLFFMRTGTAPTSSETVRFLKETFQVPVYDMYGSTEAGYVTFEDRITASVVSAFDLVDVPELGYLSTDHPYPRGELRLQTRCSTPGYFANDAATRALFDELGRLRTGDIFEQRGPDHLVWIDRRNNITKLAQGEFVSLSQLELTFVGRSRLIAQIYLYADSRYAHLVAVVVPEPEVVRATLGPNPSEARLRAAVHAELGAVARATGLKAYEVPADFLIEPERFTRENELLTESLKPSRPKLKRRYSERLDRLYADLRDVRAVALAELRANPDASAEETVARALRATLGVARIERGSPLSLRELGGDSLAATELATLLEELTARPVPMSTLLNPRGHLFDDLVSHLRGDAEASSSSDSAPSAAARARRPSQAQLELEALFEASELIAASSQAPLAPRAQTALLTGANGFLGRFLTLELLRQLPPEGRLVAIVRGRSNEHAAQRLVAAVGEHIAPELRAALERQRMLVFSGDLTRPRLGLEEQAWQLCASEVDVLVHNGAWVNHMLPYSALFEANVLGTVEVARLALHGRRKRVGFVSSIAVGQALPGPRSIREEADIRGWFETFPADTVYAGGYAATKWAGEIVLGRLAERIGCPLTIFRCGLLMPHSQLRGALNDDLLTRLLGSISLTRAAPRSFYRDGESRAPFQGLPVNFVARGIAALTLQASEGTHAFHVVDRPETGVTLDELVERLTQRRRGIVRFADHAQWYTALEQRLQELPGKVRSSTVHPLLRYWREPFGERADVRFDPSQFAAALASLETPLELPRLGSEYLHDLIDDVVRHTQSREPK